MESCYNKLNGRKYANILVKYLTARRRNGFKSIYPKRYCSMSESLYKLPSIFCNCFIHFPLDFQAHNNTSKHLK